MGSLNPVDKLDALERKFHKLEHDLEITQNGIVSIASDVHAIRDALVGSISGQTTGLIARIIQLEHMQMEAAKGGAKAGAIASSVVAGAYVAIWMIIQITGD